jgi:hypothetical protein
MLAPNGEEFFKEKVIGEFNYLFEKHQENLAYELNLSKFVLALTHGLLERLEFL